MISIKDMVQDFYSSTSELDDDLPNNEFESHSDVSSDMKTCMHSDISELSSLNSESDEKEDKL